MLQNLLNLTFLAFFDMEFIRNPPVQITIPKAQHCNEIKPQTPEDQAGIQALSQVPSREELLGKLLGSIQSPITNFARVLNQIAEAQGGADTEAAAE